MDRRARTDQSGERRRSAALIAVSAAAVLLAVVAAVVVLIADGVEPSDPVEADGWSGSAVLCSSLDPPEELAELDRGEVVRLDGIEGSDAAALLESADCSPLDATGADDHSPALDDGAAAFLVGTGTDRFDVRLVDVDAVAEPVALRVELDVPADGCGVTADFRGVLTLLVEAPADASVPDVEVVDVPLDC